MAIRSITPFLWFDKEAEEAANYYLPLFPNSRINQVSRYGDSGPGPKGSAMVVSFELMGQKLLALTAPGSAAMHQVMARELARHGDTDPAIANYREAIKINPQLSGLHSELGDAGSRDSSGWS